MIENDLKTPDTEKLPIAERTKLSNRAMNFALGSNILLAILKTGIGIVGHSQALLADGINSTSDVVYNIVVSFFVRSAHKPADDEHPYGHTQLESVGALVIGAFILTTALTIFWRAINSLFEYFTGSGSESPISPFALYIAIFTVGLKIFLSVYTKKLGDRTQNPSIIAIAQDHRNDILSASAVVIGIILGRMGFLWVDSLAGALVAFFIARTGFSILRESTDDLMDTVPGKALRQEVEKILEDVPGLQEIDSMQAHRFGQYLVINLAIFVDGSLSVDQGDAIADEVEHKISENVDYVRAVHVHFHSRRRNLKKK
ncbi:MAG: cation diffusion facilitator family transporter [Anaerolineaceae bacterium]|nr:cation diffusion facilitator family transporter [Anaerolineaceae bacterium]